MNQKELVNKLVKHYWVESLDPFSGDFLINEVDGSDDFSCIPKNSKGYIKDLSIGMLRDIVSQTVVQTRKLAYDELMK